MSKYIIDTNIFGFGLARDNHHQIRKFLKEIDFDKCLTSCFVYSELLALNYSGNNSDYLIEILDSMLQSEMVWFDSFEHTDDIANLKSMMSFLSKKNRTVDWYIAAQCLATNSILVTANKKDFDFIPGLKAKYYDQPNQRWYS